MAVEKIFYRPDSLKWYESLPSSPAVRVGDLLFISGQVSLDPYFKVLAPGDVKAQARNSFERIREIVEQAGGTMDDVVDVVSFHKDTRQIDDVVAVGREYFKKDYPAWTAIGTLGTYTADLLVNIRAIAHLGREPKQCYTPDSLKWLRAHPVSAGCKKGNLLFISGQVAADPKGQVLAPGDHGAQTRVIFDRIREIVQMAGGTLDDVIDHLSFFVDPRGMEAAGDVFCSEVYGKVPLEHVAAWTAIGSPGLYKLGMVAEFRAIADFSSGKRMASTPETIWWRSLTLSGGTKKEGGHLIGISGQVASDGDGNIVNAGDVAGQARYDFEQIRKILAGFGASLDNIVEITSFHKDPRAWEIVMKVGEEIFPKGKGPAWTPVGMTGLWKEGYLHEIYALAVV